MLKMLFMLAVIYIAYRLFTYKPALPGRKPQDHIRNPHRVARLVRLDAEERAELLAAQLEEQAMQLPDLEDALRQAQTRASEQRASSEQGEPERCGAGGDDAGVCRRWPRSRRSVGIGYRPRCATFYLRLRSL